MIAARVRHLANWNMLKNPDMPSPTKKELREAVRSTLSRYMKYDDSGVTVSFMPYDEGENRDDIEEAVEKLVRAQRTLGAEAIIKRMTDKADGLHFAGLLREEKGAREAIKSALAEINKE